MFAALAVVLCGSFAEAGITQVGDSFRFSYSDGASPITYIYSPGSVSGTFAGSLNELTVNVGGAYYFYPSNAGGPRVELNGAEYWPWEDGPTKVLTNTPIINDNGTPADSADDYVLASFRTSAAGDHVDYSYKFSLDGPTLKIEVEAAQPKVAAWTTDRTEDQSPGDSAGNPPMRPYIVPYMPHAVAIVEHPDDPVFFAATFDLSQSEATRITGSNNWYDEGSVLVGQQVDYDKMTNGARHLSHDVLELTVTRNVEDVFRELPEWTRTSPYREDLRDRVVYDNWLTTNVATGTGVDLQRLYRHGVRDLLMILHDWQRYGYDVKLPDHLPPNPARGGEQAMRQMLDIAENLGYKVAIHENYIDNYPDAPSYDSANNALNSDGSFTTAWLNPSTGVQSYQVNPARCLSLMQANAPTIADYGVTAGFVDVFSSINFGAKTDHNVLAEGACKGRTMIEKFIEVMDYARSMYNGPFLGEGGWSTLYAGAVDGVEPALTLLASWDMNPWFKYMPVVDYDLMRVHPRMVNHGPGYYSRFFGGPTPDPTPFETARAHTIAFGRAGFIDTTMQRTALNLPEAFREYYTMRPIQHELALANVASVRYEKDGQYRTLSQALFEGNPRRVRIEWDCGATVWANAGNAEWSVTLPDSGETYALAPKNGWLVYKPGPQGLLAYSTNLGDGSRLDYSHSDTLTYRYVGAPQNEGGAAAISNSEWGTRDIHSVTTLAAKPFGVPLLETSVRGSSNLAWQSAALAIYAFSEAGASTTVTYKDAPESWRTPQGRLLTDAIEVWRRDQNGQPVEKINWNTGADNNSIAWTALKDVEYELRLGFAFRAASGGGWFEEGEELSLCADVVGAAWPVTYQWFKDGEEIAGAVDACYGVPAASADHSGVYTCRVTESDLTVHETSPLPVEIFAVGALPGLQPLGVLLAVACCCLAGVALLWRRSPAGRG